MQAEEYENDKVYIHEVIDVIGHNRARYMHHMTANWCPEARKVRNQRCYAVWGTVGSTGHWPEVVNLWEQDGWDGLADDFAHEVSHPGMQDPDLAEWWAAAASLRRGGVDRIVVPEPWSPTIDRLIAAGRGAELYAHELVTVAPGAAPEFLAALREVGVAAVEETGAEVLGAFRVAMVNDSECIVLWSFRDWKTWSAYERAWLEADSPIAPWRAAAVQMRADWKRWLLVDAPLSPLRTGRQPEASDRLPLDEI